MRQVRRMASGGSIQYCSPALIIAAALVCTGDCLAESTTDLRGEGASPMLSQATPFSILVAMPELGSLIRARWPAWPARPRSRMAAGPHAAAARSRVVVLT
jgi:hypothetical protein